MGGLTKTTALFGLIVDVGVINPQLNVILNFKIRQFIL